METPPRINEALYLLQQFAPAKWEQVKMTHSLLGGELESSLKGGDGAVVVAESTSSDKAEAQRRALNVGRAQVQLAALETAQEMAEEELRVIRRRIATGKNIRFTSLLVSAVCSTSVMGALALSTRVVEIVSALVGAFVSIGGMITDRVEAVSQSSSISDVYEKMWSATYKAGLTMSELQLLVQHAPDSADLEAQINTANGACAELYELLGQTSAARKRRSVQAV